jgi:hypothetical protein
MESIMDAIILDQPHQIQFAQMATLKSALKLECLGMTKRGRSAYSICKEKYGLKGTKQSVLAQMEAMVKSALEP